MVQTVREDPQIINSVLGFLKNVFNKVFTMSPNQPDFLSEIVDLLHLVLTSTKPFDESL